jgi:tRNA(fMet)-specific endonuclease VapC
MRFVLDTSAYSAFNRGDQRLLPWFRAEHHIVLPMIVAGELRAGFAAGGRRQQNEDLLQRFMDSPNVSLLGLTDQTTHCFAQIFAALRAAGTPIGVNDMWIAAMAIEHDVAILTLDADFGRVPDLATIDIDTDAQLDVDIDGGALRLTPVRGPQRQFEVQDGWPAFVAVPGHVLTDADVRRLRDSDQG